MNIKLLKCYKDVLNMQSLLKNYGFFIYFFIFLLFFITFTLFYCKYYSILKNTINIVSKAKYNIIRINQKKNNHILTKNIKVNAPKNITKKNNRKSYPYLIIKNKGKVQTKRNMSKNNFQSSKSIIKSSIKNKNILSNSYNKKKENIKKYEEILKYNDIEINSLVFEKALIFDKRNYIQIYFSLLKLGNLFIFSFYSNSNDYNSQIIKIVKLCN